MKKTDYQHFELELDCEEVKELLLLYVLDREDLSLDEGWAIENHLQECSKCLIEYKKTQFINDALLANRDYLIQEGAFADDEPETELPALSKEESRYLQFQEIIKRDIARKKRQKRRELKNRLIPYIKFASAAAACLVIAIGVWFTLLQGKDINSSNISMGNKTPRPADITIENTFAELITPTGQQFLEFDQPFETTDRPQEIRLGGVHRVVMNANTAATFTVEPVNISSDRRARYEVQLSKGEAYIEVVPGHPFAVKTNNALLNITGTKFNVTANSDETKLTLLKGSVEFSLLDAQHKSVNVTAGYSSSVTGLFEPTEPKQTNVLAVTAWARNFVLQNALTNVQPRLDKEFLDSIQDSWIQTTPPNLDEIDYEKWRDDHRDWFKREFPWIFDIQKFVNEQHGIKADYIELLIVSGDIWQFNYPRPFGKAIPICNPALVERLEKHYGVTLEQFKNVDNDNGLPSVKPGEIYHDSLTKWYSAVINAGQNTGNLSNKLLFFSLRAGQYLTNTRTAAYLWIKQNQQKVQLEMVGFDNIAFNKRWIKELSIQVHVTSQMLYLSQELFVLSETYGCEAQPKQLFNKFLNQFNIFEVR